MKARFPAPVCLLLLLLVPAVEVLAGDQIDIRVHRLSDRAVVFTEDTMENNIVAVAAEKGLIVFDTSGLPSVARKIRRMIEEEFGRNDFLYVINTHHHWDHSFGNAVFSEAAVIGHEDCPARVRRDEEGLPRRIENLQRNIAEGEAELAGLDPGSDEAVELRERLPIRKRMLADYSESMVFAPPTVTFNDRMTVDLGDLTLKLFYFGRAHSGTDILIQIPEEGLLLTGDLFLDRGWLPLFAGSTTLDIPRWIEVLGLVLDGEEDVRQVIPGHQELWTREKLAMWRDYIVDLWEAVGTADAEGLDIGSVEARFPLGPQFSYLTDLGHDEAELRSYHQGNIRGFWRQIKESASDEIDRAITESGIEAAREKFRELRSDPRQRYFFDENAFNALGYRLMGEEKLPAAIEVFKMNVEMYPGSWNVYDSFAEACMNAGEKKAAVENYRKSIELNPDNRNGREILKRLEEES